MMQMQAKTTLTGTPLACSQSRLSRPASRQVAVMAAETKEAKPKAEKKPEKKPFSPPALDGARCPRSLLSLGHAISQQSSP